MGARTPAFLLACAVAGCLAFAAIAALLAARPPWLGMDLTVQNRNVVVTRLSAQGPAASAVRAGDRLVAVNGIVLDPTDLTPEPDVFKTYALLNQFRDRQDQLHRAKRSGAVQVNLVGEDGKTRSATITARPTRPLSSLPVIFWFQLGVGVIAGIIAAWIWALKPSDRAAQMFGLSGLAMVVCTCAASVYSTRELGFDAGLMRVLTSLNILGAGGFGIAMIQLFLIYPRRLVHGWPLWIAPLFCGAWLTGYLANIMWAADTSQHLIVLEMLAILAAIGWQVFATRNSPTDRAVLIWLGLSVALGAGAFVLSYALPLMIGFIPAVDQGYLFAVFLVIYIGMALGLRRYRLFDIGEWAFRILFYIGAALAFLAVDAALIWAMHFAPASALGLSLLGVAFLYMPLRDLIWRKTVARRRVAQHELFELVMDTAFAGGAVQRAERWTNLVNSLFDPLETAKAEGAPADPIASADGLELILPATADAPALVLRYPWKGRGLYGPVHLKLARQLTRLMRHAEASRNAFEQGAAGERRRIARDLHDDVGARLLSGLHKPDVDETRDVLREAMADMRTIVSGLTGANLPLARVLAQLRHETGRRLEGAGIELDWPHSPDEDDETPLPYIVYKNLGSGHREVVSNIIKHARATRVAVGVNRKDGFLTMIIADDGQGLAASADPDRPGGMGLTNIARRIEEVGGRIGYPPSSKGVTVRLDLPLVIDETLLPDVASAHG